MSWSRERSIQRIRAAQESAPTAAIALRRFDEFDLEARRAEIRRAQAEYNRYEDLIFNVGRNQAVLVNGVHVYARILGYHEAVAENGLETVRAHRRLLQMLHTHYSMSDFIAEDFEAQRVDYHGPRMHAVIPTPVGAEQAYERARRAIAFAQALRQAIERANRELDIDGLPNVRIRIGIDSGPAVAVNSGRGSEPEPLFLGDPANYAAKLAALEAPGIYISDRVRRDLGIPSLSPLPVMALAMEREIDMSAGIAFDMTGRRLLRDVPDAAEISNGALRKMREFARGAAGHPNFQFQAFSPPLRNINFANLSPASSIRMGLVSLFADLSGFTDYVSQSIRNGRIEQMVSNLHVIRAEMAATVREDFDGRKVRFIGDCIHAELAEGTAQNVDVQGTVVRAVEAAGGLRSSFEVCQLMLPDIGHLGLGVGLEFGETPITRLGIRGSRSVRCSTSRAVSSSEFEQERCEGDESAIGIAAYAVAPPSIRQMFGAGRKMSGLDYETATAWITPAARVRHNQAEAVAQPHSDRGR